MPRCRQAHKPRRFHSSICLPVVAISILIGCEIHPKPVIQDQEGRFTMNLPEEWMLCSNATVDSLGKLNNGWVDTLYTAQKNPDRNRVVGCARDPDQRVQVVVRWTKEWLPRIFVPSGGIST